ncbi:SDR family oxidoreductase [Chitinophaga pinensis]|uniref:Short-chain dehydrogenase/reductase SDR n=1 Tax=Chitinophaga pinensis (strain ATCC 43595 / DSM 2588 / LMG 13176 / NBRC 15968 / NCIMB 11800 / UQM 2034) TaxID=485918 RepID=A0A979G9I9_CHIPD|nr:SDR family oxidoreductase [Chitinophaga pinensis]ACU63152.1 short-chain dehydrogenase/reductase SDR [Chitinophaga pinensis DSM 2588]
MENNVTGKVVLITGASSGIGEATALLLAEKGAKVVLGARREDRLQALAARIIAAGGAVIYAVTDVKKRADLTALVSLALAHFGRLDVLINNAGIASLSPMDHVTVDEWDEMIDVNIRGVLHGIAAGLPVFRQQKSGHFINVASTAGLKIIPNMGVYAATKSAVRFISEGLRQEAGPDLRVTVISPGYTQTELGNGMSNQELRAQTAAGMEKMAIAPGAIAAGILYAIEQPAAVDVNELVIRPTAQA